MGRRDRREYIGRHEKPSSTRSCASRSAGSVAPRPGMLARDGGGDRGLLVGKELRRAADATREEAAVAVGGAMWKRKWCVVCPLW